MSFFHPWSAGVSLSLSRGQLVVAPKIPKNFCVCREVTKYSANLCYKTYPEMSFSKKIMIKFAYSDAICWLNRGSMRQNAIAKHYIIAETQSKKSSQIFRGRSD